MVGFGKDFFILGVAACITLWIFSGCASTPNQRLLMAVENGSPEEVQKSLDGGADPDAVLAHAVKQRRFDIVRLLLNQGANPNMGDTYLIDGLTIVDAKTNRRFAVKTKEIKDYMIGVYVISDVPEERSKALEALKSGRYYFHYQLKKIGGKTPLYVAIDNNDEEMIRLLLKHGAVAVDSRIVGNADLCPWYPYLSKERVIEKVSGGSSIHGQYGVRYNRENAEKNMRTEKGRHCIIEKDGNGFRAYQAPLQKTAELGSALEYARSKGNADAVHLFEDQKKNAIVGKK